MCGFLLSATVVRANIPGGGNTGTGANVTLTDNGSTVTMANGIMSIVITKSSAQIGTINYTFNNTGGNQTLNLVSGNPNGGKLYWENSNNQGLSFNYSVVANNGDYAEVSLPCTTAGLIGMEIHFAMRRGSTGFYVAVIWSHLSTDAAIGMGECRDNIYAGSIFNWMSVDATRNRLMSVTSGATSFSSVTFCASAFAANDAQTSWTRPCNSICAARSRTLPPSIAVSSRMSSISPCMRDAFLRMIERNR